MYILNACLPFKSTVLLGTVLLLLLPPVGRLLCTCYA